jgi:effector-binding domain-containing protein
MMFKIGEFASFVKVPVKTLRYYDEIDIFKPAKIDSESGYRYYSGGQIPLLNKILVLREIGLSLNEISYVLENKLSNEELINLLNLRSLEIAETIRLEEERKRKVSSMIKFLREEDNAMNYDVVIKEVAPFKAACLRDIIPSYSEQGHLWMELVEHINKYNAKILPGCLVIYYDSGFKDNQVDAEVVEIISCEVPDTNRIKYREIPGITAASVVHKGSYETISLAYTALLKWVEENGYSICGPNREIYFEGAWSVKSPEDYVTEIHIPVCRAE